ncbi:ANTAR domain-containing protein [Rhodococcus sp. SJ-3]|uniref:ANTAR domain-containing protein n=1 Tax=Rhodococcus sp. SJ-3 TaxID=3454628 RepID=UPI003F794175
MAELARSMTDATDLESSLERLTTAAIALIPGADSAGVLMVTGPSEFETHAATSELTRRVDKIQAELREGPCVDAALEAEMTHTADLRSEPRWPQFSAAAVEAGVFSMLSFRLFTHGNESGALNLFASEAGAFDAESMHVGGVLAAHAAIAVLSSRKELQFKSALASRDLIGQAKGMLMERFAVGAEQAFQMMVQLSQETNTPVSVIAARIVESGPGHR